MKAKKGRQQKQLADKRKEQPAPDHRKGFDQLLDDAIFGVPAKPKKRS
jgi:hypothetical protein